MPLKESQFAICLNTLAECKLSIPQHIVDLIGTGALLGTVRPKLFTGSNIVGTSGVSMKEQSNQYVTDHYNLFIRFLYFNISFYFKSHLDWVGLVVDSF